MLMEGEKRMKKALLLRWERVDKDAK